MKKCLIVVLLFLNTVSVVAQQFMNQVSRPEELLPKFVNIHDVKYSEDTQEESNHSSTEGVVFTYNVKIFINNYPYYIICTVNAVTKDTLNKSVYKYYEDKDTLEFYKEYGVGENPHNYYNRNGQIVRQENYFNNYLQNIIYWHYDEKGNITKEDKVSYYKSKQSRQLVFEYSYNELNQLAERKRLYNDKLIERVLWYYDGRGNIAKEENYSNSYKYTTEKNYDQENRLVEQKEYKNDSLVKTSDYSRFYDEKYLAEERLKGDKHSDFLKRKTTKEYDERGNCIKTTFLDDEKYFESDRVSGTYKITKRTIIYK